MDTKSDHFEKLTSKLLVYWGEEWIHRARNNGHFHILWTR